ncbi:glycosyltransferase [Leptothoe spongobia]|uniref:Glycosyltransferase n=1 Tax=Leptothoe spongobia TAU-MAC 1115 TaxID=1967444 RepID=A0A947DJU2_9CYAN|nr:glycosyltransferase [Leptothoe spongobia]MBT9317211.1 glycosyltransferase [Leptothoe spongobia TAU-MAC 1115]
MRKPVLTIFYQYNPWQSTIGGIQSLINTFIKFAPDTFSIRLVGTGADNGQVVGQWHESELLGRPIQFFPLFTLLDDNVRKLVPTTVRYTAALLSKTLQSDFMHFHRIEPTLAARGWLGDKTLFVHNDIPQQMSSAKGAKTILWQQFPQLYFWLERQLMEQFDQVLSCNSASTKFYQQNYPSMVNRIMDVRNAVDTSCFKPLAPGPYQQAKQQLLDRLRLKPSTRLLLFAGRLHPQKDPLLLLRALAATPPESDIHLLVAGDGDLKSEVEQAIEQHNISSRVTLLGAVPKEEMVTLYQVSDVFVLSSRYEGLPIAMLESLACGTPVVTTDCGQGPSLLTSESGLVVSQREPQSLAQALVTVVDNPQRFTPEACMQAVSPHSAQHVVEPIYNSMLQRWHVSQANS